MPSGVASFADCSQGTWRLRAIWPPRLPSIAPLSAAPCAASWRAQFVRRDPRFGPCQSGHGVHRKKMRHGGEIEGDNRRMCAALRQGAKSAAGAERRHRDTGLGAEFEQRQHFIGPAWVKYRIRQTGKIAGAQAQPVGGARRPMARAFGQTLLQLPGTKEGGDFFPHRLAEVR